MTITTPDQVRDDQHTNDAHPGVVVPHPQTAGQDHGGGDAHHAAVLAGPKQVRDDHYSGYAQSTLVVPHPQTPTTGHLTSVSQKTPVSGGSTTPDQTTADSMPIFDASGRAQTPTVDHVKSDAQGGNVDSGSTTPDQTISPAETESSTSDRAQTSPTTKKHAASNDRPSSATQTPATDQEASGYQSVAVGSGPRKPEQANDVATTKQRLPVLVSRELAVLAERVHALEEFRKACANQHRALIDTKPHKDGKRRGQHLPTDHPVAISSAGIVGDIKVIEDQFVKLLAKEVKRSPLGPWIKSQHGLGEKTIARLLGAIGDPYWNDLHGRPRTVSELWSFCGYRPGTRRAKGDQLRYSPDAKMRAHVVIEPIIKLITKPCYSVKGDKNEYLYAVHSEDECTCSPYRVLYDQARDKYRDTLHPEDCSRCGPKGHPAKAGSPRSAKHQHAMACRVVKKAILKELWREAKRLHELPGDQAEHVDLGGAALDLPAKRKRSA